MDAAMASPPVCVLVFARYPIPGQAKTRLIPALGEAGAAQLYQHLAEWTMTQVRALAPSVDIALWYSGATAETMGVWLGDGVRYCAQPVGDLGHRLTTAMDWAFAQGYGAVLVIGTDCPGLDTAILTQGIEALTTGAKLVLGPAQDGGYYLLGLTESHPALFEAISWSTDTVLAQTVATAARLHLTPVYLPTLADIDRPEDLAQLPSPWLPPVLPRGFR